MKDCYYREIWNVCHCLPILDPSRIKPEILSGSRPPFLCDAPKTTNCVRPRVDDDPMIQARVEECKNRCLPPCNYWRYQLKVSDAPLYALRHQSFLKSQNTTIENIIRVSMAYPSLDYMEFQQHVKKSFEELISDLGGQIGL